MNMQFQMSESILVNNLENLDHNNVHHNNNNINNNDDFVVEAINNNFNLPNMNLPDVLDNVNGNLNDNDNENENENENEMGLQNGEEANADHIRNWLGEELDNQDEGLGQEADMAAHGLSEEEIARRDEANEMFMRIQDLNSILMTNLLGSDAQLSLFVTAVMSYRYKKVLTVRPHWLYKNDVLDIDRVAATVNEIHSLPSYFVLWEQEFIFGEDENKVLNMLHWLFCSQRKYLKQVHQNEVQTVMKTVGYPKWLRKPNYIFEVACNTPPNCEEELYNLQSAHYPLYWAFFGGKLDKFFGLLHDGFKPYLKKGKTIHLELDASMAIQKSPFSPAWGASILAPRLSCIAATECLCNPMCVRLLESNGTIAIRDISSVRIRYFFIFCQSLDSEDTPPGKWSVFCDKVKAKRNQLTFAACIFMMTSIWLMRRKNFLSLLKASAKSWLTALTNPGKQLLRSLTKSS